MYLSLIKTFTLHLTIHLVIVTLWSSQINIVITKCCCIVSSFDTNKNIKIILKELIQLVHHMYN